MKIRDEFLKETQSYATQTPEVGKDVLDCSLGVNPYGFPEIAMTAFRQFDFHRMANYPHGQNAKEAICEYWKEQAGLKPENIVLTDGSIEALYLINGLFAQPEIEVAGFAPTFTDMVVNVEIQKMRYIPTFISKNNDTAFDLERLLKSLSPKTALVYIDNPNNPTGRILAKEDLEKILFDSLSKDIAVLIDEAYGDFLEKEESALSLWGKYPNLLVVRTFSKGFGLAGLRAGYIVADEKVVQSLAKISNPYMMNELAREVVAFLLRQADPSFFHLEDISKTKEALKKATGNRLTFIPSDHRVPICTLCCVDESANLQRLLLNEGILTVSGSEFLGLGSHCVRVRVPKFEEANRLIDAVKKINETSSSTNPFSGPGS